MSVFTKLVLVFLKVETRIYAKLNQKFFYKGTVISGSAFIIVLINESLRETQKIIEISSIDKERKDKSIT